MPTELFTKLSKMISETAGISVTDITLESEFQKLGMDSLDTLALLSDLEAEFNINIPNKELLQIKTVGQAVESLQKRIS